MRRFRKGIGTTAVAIIVVVIIAVAAGAYAMAVVSGGSSTASGVQSSTTTSGATTTITSSAQSSSSGTSSSSIAVSTSASASTTSLSTYTSTYTTSYATSYSTTYTTIFTFPTSSTSSSTTCTSTSSNATSTEAQLDNFSLTFAEYSEMAVRYNGTENGNSFDTTYDYSVVSTTSTSYLVNVTVTEGPMIVHYTDYVLKNGTAVWVYFNGQNYTGMNAFFVYFASLAPYYLGNLFGEAGLLGQLSNSSMVHVAGTGTLKLGPTEANVTDYEANYLPLKETTCDESIYFTRFSLQVGNVTGESVLLLTGMDIAGTLTSSGVTDSLDLSLHITSVTKTA